MALIGKYLATTMTRQEAALAFLGHRVQLQDGERYVLVGGTIVGEAPVGLWIVLDSLWFVDDQSAVYDALPGHPSLLRWAFLNAAVLHDEGPDAATMGFRPR